MLQILTRVAAAAAVALLVALGAAGPVAAHAQVESSTPAAGTISAAPPAVITVSFDEPVTLDPDAVRLVDQAGAEAAITVTQPEPNQLRVVPAPALTDGQWALAWTMLSVDGHLVPGTLPFAVGAGSVADAADPPADRVPGVLLTALEPLAWLAGAAAAMLVAGARTRPSIILAAVAAVAATARIAVLAAQAGGWQYAAAAGETRASVAVIAAAALTVVAGMVRVPAARTALAAAALGCFAAQSVLSGHHLAHPGYLITVSHAVHLLAAAAWVGAVLALATNRTVDQAVRTRRQSTIAVLALIPAGLVLAWMSVTAAFPDIADLPDSPWARLLAVKLGILVSALALGVLNHRALSPSRVHRTLQQPGRLRRFLLLEVLVILSVAVTTAALAATPQRPAPPPTRPPSPVTEVGQSAQALLTAADGSSAHAQWAGTGGSGLWQLHLPGTDTGTAELTATHQGTGIQSTIVELSPQGPGRLTGEGQLPLPGSWDVLVRVSTGPFDTREYTGTVTTGTSPSSAAPGGAAGTGEEPP